MTNTASHSLLLLNFSPRGAASVTRQLSAQFVQTWAQAGTARQVLARAADDIEGPFPDGAWIEASATDVDARTEQRQALLRPSDEEIERLQRATHLVVAAPMHNFSVPWRLKAYIDTLVRAGKTFSVDAQGRFVPLLQAGKKLLLITSSAGAYEQGGPLASMDHLTPYVRDLFRFIGVQDFECVSAAGQWGGPELARASQEQASQRLGELAARWQAGTT